MSDQFKTMLEQLVQKTDSSHDPRWWDEDDFVPVSPAEAAKGLRETIAMARAEGWIPKEDPGCQCFICRAWRNAGL
jgi:hypothetical protein